VGDGSVSGRGLHLRLDDHVVGLGYSGSLVVSQRRTQRKSSAAPKAVSVSWSWVRSVQLCRKSRDGPPALVAEDHWGSLSVGVSGC
jgi:hypothetical protein